MRQSGACSGLRAREGEKYTFWNFGTCLPASPLFPIFCLCLFMSVSSLSTLFSFIALSAIVACPSSSHHAVMFCLCNSLTPLTEVCLEKTAFKTNVQPQPSLLLPTPYVFLPSFSHLLNFNLSSFFPSTHSSICITFQLLLSPLTLKFSLSLPRCLFVLLSVCYL